MTEYDEDPGFEFVECVERYAKLGRPLPDKYVTLVAAFVVAEGAPVGLTPIDEVRVSIAEEGAGFWHDNADKPPDRLFHTIGLYLCDQEVMTAIYYDGGFCISGNDVDFTPEKSTMSQIHALHIKRNTQALYEAGYLALKTNTDTSE